MGFSEKRWWERGCVGYYKPAVFDAGKWKLLQEAMAWSARFWMTAQLSLLDSS